MRPMLPLLLGLALVSRSPGADAPGSPDLPAEARARIGTPRLRHGGLIRALAFTPDGKYLASAGHDRTVSLWELPAGREVLRCAGHTSDVLAVCVAPDPGKEGAFLLASSGADGTVRLWDGTVPGPGKGVPRGREVRRFHLIANFVEALAFSADGKRLAAGADNGAVRVWDTATHGVVHVLRQERAVRCLAFAPDGKTLASSGDTGAVRLWDVEHGAKVREFGEGLANALAFSPDGKSLAAWTYGDTVTLFDPATGEAQKAWKRRGKAPSGRDHPVYQVHFRPDGRALAAPSPDGSVHLHDPESGKTTRLAGHAGRATAACFSPDGKTLASAGADHLVRLWDVTSGKEVSPPAAPEAPLRGLAVSSDGKLLATVTEAGELAFWDLPAGRPRKSPLPIPEGVTACAFVPGTRKLALATVGPDLRLWDLDGGKEVFNELTSAAVGGLAFAPDGGVLATTGEHRYVILHDPGTGKELGRSPGRDRLGGLAFSPDGKSLATVGRPASVRLWEAREGKLLREFPGHPGGALAVAFGPGGEVVSSGKDRLVKAWDPKTGKEKRLLAAHRSWVYDLAFAPGGRLLATGHDDGGVRLWDARTGRLLHELRGHRGRVVEVAFASESLLVSGGLDTTVLVWEVNEKVRAGEAVAVTLPGEELEVNWKALASTDPAEGFLAVQTLARAGGQVVPRIRGHVKPIDGERLRALVEDLDSAEFAVRERAFERLAKQGAFAEPFLRKALEAKPSLEKARRIELLLGRLADDRPAHEHLRALRAVAILEMLGGTEAESILRDIARGAPEAELTRRAREALEVLRPEKPPGPSRSHP